MIPSGCHAAHEIRCVHKDGLLRKWPALTKPRNGESATILRQVQRILQKAEGSVVSLLKRGHDHVDRLCIPVAELMENLLSICVC